MHFRAGDVTYLSSASRPPVIAVTQWTRTAQLSNFDNALLCSAFKFYLPSPVCWRFLTFLSLSLRSLKNALNAMRERSYTRAHRLDALSLLLSFLSD